jgi:hypothetical protein
MIGIFGLQGAYQNFKFGKRSQIFEARVVREKRPAGESAADAAFKPLEGCRGLF